LRIGFCVIKTNCTASSRRRIAEYWGRKFYLATPPLNPDPETPQPSPFARRGHIPHNDDAQVSRAPFFRFGDGSGSGMGDGGCWIQDSGCGVLARRVGLRLCWDACKEIAHKNSIKIAIYVRGPWKRVAKSMRKLMWLLL